MSEYKTPDKIYLQIHGEWDGEKDVVTWCEDKINDDDVEYVRKDRIATEYASMIKDIADSIKE